MFNGFEETFRYGIIATISFSTYTLCHFLVEFENLYKIITYVLNRLDQNETISFLQFVYYLFPNPQAFNTVFSVVISSITHHPITFRSAK